MANKYCNNFLKGLGFGGIFEDALEEMIEKTNENSIFKHMVPTLRYLKCPRCSYIMQV